MAEKRENSYDTILKRISSFGGVQIFNILITLIRGKFVALLLGPEGMGISSLFTSSITTIQQVSSLGLNLAFVKEVASHKENADRLPQILALALRLIILTSLLGALICFLLSPLLSKWSFGNYNYTFSFVFLSAAVAFSVGGAGYLSLLQGLGEVKKLAIASIIGGLAGLIIGVPLFYFFGDKGIVPSIVVWTLSSFLFYFFSFRKSVDFSKTQFILKEHQPLIKRLISLGFILMAGSLASTFTTYVINIFIREFGSVDNIGLFQAANSITNQYVGLIFSALALDYFPRLSAIVRDIPKMNEVVNRQAEIVIVILTPLILILLLTAPWVIQILLSETFLSVTPLVRWLALGVFLQGVTFPLGYLFLANENRKVYFWVDVVMGNLIWMACSFIFYYYFSLIGLGVSLVVRTFLDIFINYGCCRKFYGFRYTKKTIIISLICLVIGTGGFLISLLPDEINLVWLPVLLILSIIFSVYIIMNGLKTHTELDKNL